MSLKRIFATFVGDRESEEDREAAIVMHAKIKDNNKIDALMEVFGYVKDWCEEFQQYKRYPFILNINNEVVFDFGGYAPEGIEIARTNLLNKDIVPNEFFTYFDESSEEEWVYRIEQVTPI